MKPPPKNPEFDRFTSALRHIVQVPKATVMAKMSAEKQARQRRRQRQASAPASPGKG
ncbi:hypothetical protein SBA1_1070013 [Candidatus Sulfotelmatobacter kueseliae]|uniref:Uncharacterized protein n=1 Tax=Candidatus Sulfotelmatobacter kueseliae TaxID=2042962 RepID=A0A2U3JYZ6_9BACT|nr:hypothetical protein SBA1_1070013 [Candidatus Sulfotelmatobacter kueseliae]